MRNTLQKHKYAYKFYFKFQEFKQAFLMIKKKSINTKPVNFLNKFIE